MQKTYNELVEIMTLIADARITTELIEIGLSAKHANDNSSVLHVYNVILESIQERLNVIIDYIDDTYIFPKP